MNTFKLCQQKPLLCIVFLANTVFIIVYHKRGRVVNENARGKALLIDKFCTA